MHNSSNFPLSNLKFNSYTPIGKQQQKKLAQILNNLIDIPQAAQFLHPVAWRQLQLDDYPQIIKHPMNLYKVQQKIKARDYTTVQQVLDHIQLIWDNCKEYNPEGYFFEIAQKLQKTFKKMIKNYLPSVQCITQQTSQNVVNHTQASQESSHQMVRKSVAQPPPTRSIQQKAPTKQIQQKPQSLYAEESKSQKQESNQQQQIQEIPVSEKNRFHQRLKQITQQQLGQVVLMIQEYCPEGFKHISGGRYQILMDNVDGQSFKKISEKVDDFIESQKLNGGLGSKKVKV